MSCRTTSTGWWISPRVSPSSRLASPSSSTRRPLACLRGASDEDGIDEAAEAVRAHFDTRRQSVRFAGMVARMRGEGELSALLVALGMLGLQRDPAVIESAVRHVACVAAGTARTPSGLLVV